MYSYSVNGTYTLRNNNNYIQENFEVVSDIAICEPHIDQAIQELSAQRDAEYNEYTQQLEQLATRQDADYNAYTQQLDAVDRHHTEYLERRDAEQQETLEQYKLLNKKQVEQQGIEIATLRNQLQERLVEIKYLKSQQAVLQIDNLGKAVQPGLLVAIRQTMQQAMQQVMQQANKVHVVPPVQK
jgi:hypothetical protein